MAVDIRNYLTNSTKINDNIPKMSKNMKQCVVTEIREKKNGYVNPVIAYFQNGELNGEHASDFKVEIIPKLSGKTAIQVRTSYGHLFKMSNCNSNSGVREILAIRNKKTNKIRLVEVDSAVLINSALLSETEKDVAESDYKKEFKALHKTFGGKKIVSRLEQREKLNINSMLVKDEINEVVADMKVEEVMSVSNNETESIELLLPPCHRQAHSVSEVYQLQDILTEEELQTLRQEVKNSLMDKKEINSALYSQFFMTCYEQANKSNDNLECRLAGLLFAEILLHFLKNPIKKISSKKLNLCSFSSLIQEKILNEFCIKTETSITRPMTMRDKTLCYIIAISLICCNFQINLKVLSTVTSIHLNKLARLARVVGAVPVSKDEEVFILKLPLPALPKSSKARIRRK